MVRGWDGRALESFEVSGAPARTPEQRLWVAVLTQAAVDYHGKGRADKATVPGLHQYEARHFFESRSGGWAVWFRMVCDLAGVDAERLREGVLRLDPAGLVDGDLRLSAEETSCLHTELQAYCRRTGCSVRQVLAAAGVRHIGSKRMEIGDANCLRKFMRRMPGGLMPIRQRDR